MKRADRIIAGSYWKTRSGLCARIDADDYEDKYQVSGRVFDLLHGVDKVWTVTTWTDAGEYMVGELEHANDLIEPWTGRYPWTEKSTPKPTQGTVAELIAIYGAPIRLMSPGAERPYTFSGEKEDNQWRSDGVRPYDLWLGTDKSWTYAPENLAELTDLEGTMRPRMLAYLVNVKVKNTTRRRWSLRFYKETDIVGTDADFVKRAPWLDEPLDPMKE